MANRLKFKVLGTFLLAVVILTACGQKRALYLPEEPATNNTSQDSQPPIGSAEEGKD
jgi:predicted small lipoprotein YifL